MTNTHDALELARTNLGQAIELIKRHHKAVDSGAMIDSARLEQLRQAATAEDWPLAGELYIELSLAARGSSDRWRVEALAPCIRLRDSTSVVAVIAELRGVGRELSLPGETETNPDSVAQS